MQHDRNHDPGWRPPAPARHTDAEADGPADAHEDPPSAAEAALAHLLAERRGAGGPTAPGRASHG